MGKRLEILAALAAGIVAAGWAGAGAAGAAGWQRIPVPTAQILEAVDFPAPDVGYAVGRRSTVIATRDGGVTWGALPLPPELAEDDAHAVAFRDAHSGFVVGGSVGLRRGFVARTHDGGRTWAVVERAPDALRAVAVWGPTVVAVGNSGAVVRSGDDGATWDVTVGTGARTESPTRRDADVLRAVAFLGSAAEVVAVGDDGAIERSRDAGHTWRSIPFNYQKFDGLTMTFGMAPLGPGAWAMGGHDIRVDERTNFGGIRFTRNDGATFVGAEVRPEMHNVDAIRRSSGGLLAATSRFVGREELGTILRSGDGGRSWRPIFAQRDGPFLDLAAPAQGRIVAVGTGGRVYATGLAAAPWAAAPPPLPGFGADGRLTAPVDAAPAPPEPARARLGAAAAFGL